MLVNCLFSRDPERPFDIERPRNWGSFGAELNGLKLWRRGGFRCFWEAGKLLAGCWWKVFGRLVWWKMPANCLFSIGIQSVRLTSNVRGIGARLEQNSIGVLVAIYLVCVRTAQVR